ncbi:ester cyclase [Actinokineospora bangkokensis]|uniref:SnoaL-like domain-containing protein n=1 Tax=Actinokineospora bangkokensis TaxID=1193682 RepID=A0A1Q9LGY4_9PSEU|nr:ester cyclase [Actinokineospora bangkokensis]OLR91283.1 hypothetical protein BJP25_26825 [Actinokineospora bangkokensis]
MTTALTRPDARERFAATAAFVREALVEADHAALAHFAHPDVRDVSALRLFDDGLPGLGFALRRLHDRFPDLRARVDLLRECGPGTVEAHLALVGTYRAPDLMPSGRDGRRAGWRQVHRFAFRGERVAAHLGWVDRAALRDCLGPAH